MKIVREQREQNTSLIRVTVGQEDYREEVEKALREYKRKANVPGFRPGMVPMGIIKKMYGKGVLAEQSYRKASNSVFEYLQKENIDYLGDVIPSEEQGAFDFDSGTEFEFVFEIGEAPELKLDLSEKDKLTYYKIKIDKKMHEDFRSNYLRRYGRLVDADAVTSDEALSVTLDNGEMKVEDAYVGLISMPEEERKPFIGKKVGDKMTVNVNELYRTPSQRAAVLQVKEGELEHIKPEFELEITRIRKFAEPELNEEFFKMAFPAGNVTTAEQFEAFIDEQIASELRRESDYLFTLEVRDYLVKKADLKMPEAFLKRWLYTINEGKFTMEEIEKDFDQFLKMFTWNYIQKQIIKQENITVSADEATAEAKAFAQAQFAQYGMPSAPDDMLAGYAKPEVAAEMTAAALDGAEGLQLTYCMGCRDRYARSGAESVHILELIYGAPSGSPPGISEKRRNRLELKRRMLREIWMEDDAMEKLDFKLEFTDEARALMEARMVLDTDVVRVMRAYRESGDAVVENDTGLIVTRARLGNVTFWVKFTEDAGGYTVHRVYSHRMTIETR